MELGAYRPRINLAYSSGGGGSVVGMGWSMSFGSIERMTARGLPPADIKVGATVTVVGYQNRNKPEEMRAERIIVGSKTVELR